MRGRSEEREIASNVDFTINVDVSTSTSAVTANPTRGCRACDVTSRLNLRGTVRIEHQTTNNIVVAELIAHASGM